MIFDKILLVLVWIITIIALWIFIPKDKIRAAQVAFMFKQVMTWILGLSVVQLKLIEYPVRWFSYANRSSFTFEFFVFPATCAIFVTQYPEGKSPTKRFLYYFSYCSVMTIVEVILEKNTQLVHYITWEWYWTWSSLFITFFFSRLYVRWFFKVKADSGDQVS